MEITPTEKKFILESLQHIVEAHPEFKAPSNYEMNLIVSTHPDSRVGANNDTFFMTVQLTESENEDCDDFDPFVTFTVIIINDSITDLAYQFEPNETTYTIGWFPA